VSTFIDISTERVKHVDIDGDIDVLVELCVARRLERGRTAMVYG